MGADFILCGVPACGLDEDRLARLNKIIEGLGDDAFPDHVDSIEDWRGRLNDALEAMDAGRRDVGLLDLRTLDYPLLFSGGMSWGDNPTDAEGHFLDICQCQPLFDQLAEWAKEDAEPRYPPSVQNLVDYVSLLLTDAIDRGECFDDHDGDDVNVTTDEEGRRWFNDWYAVYQALKPFQTKPHPTGVDHAN